MLGAPEALGRPGFEALPPELEPPAAVPAWLPADVVEELEATALEEVPAGITPEAEDATAFGVALVDELTPGAEP